MRKLPITTLAFLASGITLISIAQAQQTTPATPAKPATAQAAPAATSSAPKTSSKSGTTTATKPKTAVPFTLKTQKDKVSYAIGMNIGQGVGASIRQQSVDVDQAILLRGMKDALAGSKLLLTNEEVRKILTDLTMEARKKQEEQMKAAAEQAKITAGTNKKSGEEFLAANKAKEGVVTLPSGLQYKILTEGAGPKPTTTDTVTCNYRGTLVNGNEFDSSYKRGQAASFPVTGVIKGWTEALQLMPVGSKWQLYIPSEMAYGDPGRPGIPPGSTLIFEVELLSIQEKKPAVAPAPAAAPATPESTAPQKPPTSN